jgi:cobalt/nickel transport system permease protein
VGTLWAVHISDNLLQWPWWVGGFAVTAFLGWLGGRRLEDEEIPRIAVLSSAFFVASSLIHVRTLVASVHLLLNGLVGVILGPRAALAIPVGVLLQALLFNHGGLTTVGINSCVMTLPALGAWLAFAAARRRGWLSDPLRQWAVGLGVGGLTVLATVTLNALVLWLGGQESWSTLVMAVFVAHLPVVAVEALVMGATVSFLARVKPEILGLHRPAAPPALPAEPDAVERQAG